MRPLSVLLFLVITLSPPTLAQSLVDCSVSDQHRAFDFWLGEWTVESPDGKFLGKNKITLVQNGCALQENWTSANGGTGQSINYYHPGRNQWHQVWNDGGASVIEIGGNLEQGAMALQGTIFYLQQSVEREFRGRWIPLDDGRVRQVIEELTPEGEWKLWFDGIYSREPD